jgi:glucose/arabinose dehydrogenase
MIRTASYILLFFITILYSCQTNSDSNEGSHSVSDTLHISLHQIASGLENPVYLANAGDKSRRLFIVQQSGEILIIKDGVVKKEYFLDISDRVEDLLPAFSELGLLGLAFHPDFESNGRFFVYYSHKINEGKNGYISRLSEFLINPEDPDKALIESERIIKEFNCYGYFVNGGQVSFGPDGMLYLGIGEGSGDHSSGSSQDLDNVFGSIIRINVDQEKPYQIPVDNPFIDSNVPEVWAYGLRNPYRFSFDYETGLMICGDVGDLIKEEVNLVEKGKNYGWPIFEGTILSEGQSWDSQKGEPEQPLAEYTHTKGFGSAIVGSYIYRGEENPEIKGKIILADWSGDMYYLESLRSDTPKIIIIDNLEEFAAKEREIFKDGDFEEVLPKYYVNSLGQDEDGELYLVGQRGMGPSNGSGSVFQIKVSEIPKP